MHAKAPKQMKKAQKPQKQAKRSLATKKQQKRATSNQQTTLTQPLFKMTPLKTTRHRFSTKQQDEPDQDQNDNAQQPEQQQEQQQADETADPLVTMQKRVANQANQIADLQRQIADNKIILDEWQSKARQLQERVKHEIQEQHNIHDRYKREIGDVKKYSVGKFAKGLLEGVDALEAATKATDIALQRTQDDNFIKLAEGLKMTTSLFHKALGAEGIVKFESLGQTVDPNVHFITAQLAHPTAPAGTITHILKEGYHIHDRVLRPAQVVVSHNPAESV